MTISWDDRDSNNLEFSVSSDNKKVAVGMITADGDSDSVEDNLKIVAKNRGMATIALTAKEPKGTAIATSAMMGQSAVQTIMVEVR